MAINIAPKSLDTDLSELMRDVASGKAQLPEFQRSWTWDDNRIIGILASLSQGYPMGAIMRLTYGNENVKFKYRTIEVLPHTVSCPIISCSTASSASPPCSVPRAAKIRLIRQRKRQKHQTVLLPRYQ